MPCVGGVEPKKQAVRKKNTKNGRERDGGETRENKDSEIRKREREIDRQKVTVADT
jgi:hypothetical protein